ncbi:hypothetical protein DFH07DRAFT_1064189 [Mycena maculata]|uniref:DDE-1 domain-containing protein n=1 Tax=Mycena maculata TaxID=230809 RepID=A0AAD7ID53_9AGAR|nr:hypothetical protein DFH07DRAFT_1064189 [Mycena maculata]
MWLEKDFVPASAEFLDDPGDYRLLILDGHNSHCTFRFIDYAKVDGWPALASPTIILPDKENFRRRPRPTRSYAGCSAAASSAHSRPRSPGIGIFLYPNVDRNTFYWSRHPVQFILYFNASLDDNQPLIGESIRPINSHQPFVGRPVLPIHSKRALVCRPASIDSNHLPRDAVQAAYAIAMPSPVRKTASRSALAAENEQLRSLLNAAGVALDNNYAQMALMGRENGNLRQQLHAKKNKPKRTYTTSKARLMTSAEMHQALLEDLQKKQMGELHSEMRKTRFPTIRKEISEAEKAAKAKKKKLEQERKAAAKAAEKAKKAAAREVAKAAKAAARALGRGRGGVGGRRGRGGSRRGHGGGRGGGKSQDSSNDEDEELSPDSESSEEDAEVVDPNPVASATNDESDEESDFDEPSASGNSGPITANTLPSIQEDSDDDDDESDQEETGIVSFNGHRWESRRNLEFQVVWADGDVTWNHCPTSTTAQPWKIIWRTAISTTLYYYPNVNSS